MDDVSIIDYYREFVRITGSEATNILQSYFNDFSHHQIISPIGYEDCEKYYSEIISCMENDERVFAESPPNLNIW